MCISHVQMTHVIFINWLLEENSIHIYLFMWGQRKILMVPREESTNNLEALKVEGQSIPFVNKPELKRKNTIV